MVALIREHVDQAPIHEAMDTNARLEVGDISEHAKQGPLFWPKWARLEVLRDGRF